MQGFFAFFTLTSDLQSRGGWCRLGGSVLDNACLSPLHVYQIVKSLVRGWPSRLDPHHRAHDDGDECPPQPPYSETSTLERLLWSYCYRAED